MATQIINAGRSKDRSNGKNVLVHFSKVLKGNRKAMTKLVEGTLYDHPGHNSGDFHIILVTKVNQTVKTIDVHSGDVLFRTGTSKRWQVLEKSEFKKRFPQINV